MTELEGAEEALADYKALMGQGCPVVSNYYFSMNPGLDQHILKSLQEFVRIKRVAEQAKPAKRVSLIEE